MAYAATAKKEKRAVKLPTLEKRLQWYHDWEETTPLRINRDDARRDRRYYDGKQWSSDELSNLAKRHQPPTTRNRIARKINTILGDEIDKRVDPRALPRTKKHADAASAATDALRFVESDQKFDRVKSAVAKNALIEGYGGALVSLDDDKICMTHVQWDRLFYDPTSRHELFWDAKYVGMIVWADLDDAIAMYPGAQELLEQAVAHDGPDVDDVTEDTPRNWSLRRSQRVKICEMYVRLGDDWYKFCFTKGGDLTEPERTEILDEKQEHSVCPLLMVSCYVDQEGLRYGVVRNLVSPQDGVNKRSSKSLHLLSVNQVIAEHDVVIDPKKFMNELAKPDGFAEVEPDTLSSQHGPRIMIKNGIELAAAHVQLMQQDLADIDGIGPVAANMPDIPESASGRAIFARQKAASKEIRPVFDSLDGWTLRAYEVDWLCIRQTWSDEKWFRVADATADDGYRFAALNRNLTRAERFQELLAKEPPVPMAKALEDAAGEWTDAVMYRAQSKTQAFGQQLAFQAQQMGQKPPAPEQMLQQMILDDELMQEPITVDQVELMDVDIIIDVAPDTAVLEQEEYEVWTTQLAPMLIQAQMDPREVATITLELSQFRDKMRVIQSLKKGPSPQQQQAQQMMQELQQKAAQLDVMLKQADVALKQAQAQKAAADAQLSGARAAELAQPDAPQAVEGPSPLEMAKARREHVNTDLDVAKTRAQIEKDHSTTVKNHVESAATAHQMMQPPEVVEIST